MLKKIIIYGLGTFSSKILLFLMLPIYTRVIDPANYGYYDVLVTNAQLVVSIAFAEMWSGVLRYFIELKSKNDRLILVRSLYGNVIVSMVCYLAGLLILNQLIGIKYWFEIILYGLSYMLFNTSNCMCRGEGKNILFILSGIISTFVTCALSIIFCVYLKYDVSFLLVAASIGYMTAAIVVEIKLRLFVKSLHVMPDSQYRKQILLFCLPLMINSIAYSFLTMYNKNYILNNFGEIESGYYAIANKFSALIAITTSIYQQAWQEESYLIYNSKDKSRLYSKNIDLFIRIVGFTIAMILLVVGLGFEWIVGTEYGAAKHLVPIAIWGAFFSTMSGVIGNVFGAEKDTNKLFISTVAGGLFNIVLVNIFGKQYYTQGANLVILLSFMLITVIRYLLIKQKINISINVPLCMVLLLEMLLSIGIYMVDHTFIQIIGITVFLLLWFYVNRAFLHRYYKSLKTMFRNC